MASPMVESRIEPHKKAHFTLHISDRIANDDSPRGSFSSVKYNHKPAQTSDSRTTTLKASSDTAYTLKLEDRASSGDKDIFTFTGNRAAPKKSYVLLFDAASQKATLEPLSDSYTFNIATKNDRNIASQYPKIYPKKNKDGQENQDGDDDLFGEAVADDESGEPDPNNPYDFRHFLSKEKEKRGDESEYHFASSPDYRTGTGSAVNTPQLGARKPAAVAAARPKPAEPAPKKRKPADSGLFLKKKKDPAKKAQPPPAIHLERRASERPTPDAAPKPKSKAAAPPASKIKSAELVHSSDDSDIDADGGAAPSPQRPAQRSPSPPRPTQRSPSPQYHAVSEPEEEDAEGDSDDDGGLEIEVPDARPSRPRNGGALASLGLGSNLGVGGGFNSPSNGPISLASATSSVQGSPNPHTFTPRKNRAVPDADVIDFDDLGGADDEEGEEDEEDDGGMEVEDEDDADVDIVDIGPPARQSTSGHDRKPSMAGVAADEDEEDPLYQEMMAGLAGGDSSEESEEE
ncbi:hypothetical protein FB567DRAFT_177941 [Paraphoma chrysanthemicola]|uniref:Transcription elongation factor Eaf N-terminal domain-containing protein n=1 Tax=Paraphoma chrysanthemicola TaxID=798071 RepID=A0A8K0RIV5_9PLEO|nr:hypothetical protein FB567DRAFT_177941 [Paraphoma chrysanthemicola]